MYMCGESASYMPFQLPELHQQEPRQPQRQQQTREPQGEEDDAGEEVGLATGVGNDAAKQQQTGVEDEDQGLENCSKKVLESELRHCCERHLEAVSGKALSGEPE